MLHANVKFLGGNAKLFSNTFATMQSFSRGTQRFVKFLRRSTKDFVNERKDFERKHKVSQVNAKPCVTMQSFWGEHKTLEKTQKY